MSIDNSKFIPCDQVLPNIVLYIDHELTNSDDLGLIENHFGLCPSCRSKMEQETQALNFVKNLLCSALQEPAPEDLSSKISSRIDDIYNQMCQSSQPQSITEFTFTQTTYTEFTEDGTTQIEITSEIRREFPLE
jgi:anti-sigma factor (TIGR02949 family)